MDQLKRKKDRKNEKFNSLFTSKRDSNWFCSVYWKYLLCLRLLVHFQSISNRIFALTSFIFVFSVFHNVLVDASTAKNRLTEKSERRIKPQLLEVFHHWDETIREWEKGKEKRHHLATVLFSSPFFQLTRQINVMWGENKTSSFHFLRSYLYHKTFSPYSFISFSLHQEHTYFYL